MLIKCNQCGKLFNVIPAVAGSRKHCSKECLFAAMRKPRVSIICAVCGKTFEVIPSLVGISKYCSKDCQIIGIRKPIDVTCETCGVVFTVIPSVIKNGKGKYCSKECMSEGISRRFKGVNAPNWRGGRTSKNKNIRDSLAYRNWRESVFARDNWTCQDCGKRGGDLHPHHIFPFAEFSEHRLEVWNGVTLCVSCHAKVHPNLKGMVRNAS